MIPTQELVDFPLFSDMGAKRKPEDVKYSGGFVASDVLPAEWLNWFLNKSSDGITKTNEGILSIEKEVNFILSAAGLTPDKTKYNQLYNAIANFIREEATARANADSAHAELRGVAAHGAAHFTGELIFLPYLVSSPSPAEPLIDRSVFRDIDAANAPDLVARLKNELASVRGTTNFAVSVSDVNITFDDAAVTSPSAAMLRRLAAWGLRVGFLNQNMSSNFTADFSTAATRKTIRINNVDYGISGVNISTRTITVVGAPPNGQHSASFATYAVPGNHNKIRLPSLAGAAIMGAGDYDGEIDSGWGGMDMMQWHWHTLNAIAPSWTSGGTRNLSVSTPDSGHIPVSTATNLITDGINGNPRPGKQTRPAFEGAYIHTFAGRWIP